ncbi:UNVERIFIED_ORG: hypothetical protein ABID33_000999 [Xanthobacter viscosus]|jgi:hypothetical protein
MPRAGGHGMDVSGAQAAALSSRRGRTAAQARDAAGASIRVAELISRDQRKSRAETRPQGRVVRLRHASPTACGRGSMEGAACECPASRQNGGGTAEPSGGSNPWAFHISINSIEFVDYQTQGCSPQATQQPEERVSSAGVLRSGGGRPSRLAASPRRLRASCRAGTALAANPSRREPACPKASRPNAFHSKSFPFQELSIPRAFHSKASPCRT